MNSILYQKTDNIDLSTGFRYRYSYNNVEPKTLHHHDYYEVFLTVRGETIHTVNGKTFRLPEGCLVLIRPNDSHGYKSVGKEEYSFVNLAFYEETLNMLFGYISDCIDTENLINSSQPPTVQLSKNEKKQLLSSLDKLNLTDINDIQQKRLRFKRIIFDIFTRFFATSYLEQSTKPHWLENAVSEIKKQKNFAEGVDKFRELCNKSNEHICRCTKEHYNQTPTELVNEIRLNYAANILLTTNKVITDICYECGFENISWFYTAFKKKYSITPKAFRNKYKPSN